MNASQTTYVKISKIMFSLTCLLVLCNSTARAEDHFWSSLGGGSFNYWLNWVPQWVPQEDDRAIFELGMDPAYVVTFYEPATTAECLFRTDKVIFDLGGFTYTLVHPGFALIVGEGGGHVAEVLFHNGTIDTTVTHVGLWDGSNGTLDLESGLTLDISEHLLVGNDGNGLMNIHNYASVTAERAAIGGHPFGNTGVLNVDGANAELIVNETLKVGDEGEGYLNLRNGASVHSRNGYVGSEATGYGEALITDESEMIVDEWLTLGGHGGGQLTVAQAGRLEVVDLHVGGETGEGWAYLFDADSRIDASGYIFVGDWTSGTMNVSLQSSITAETLLVGANETGVGELTISDADTTVTVLNNIQSGQWGVGTINIIHGADVRTTTPDGWIKIGENAGSDGYILVDDGSMLTAEQALLVVGGAGQAGMDILGGSEVHTSGELFMGWGEGGSGQMIIRGEGSSYTADSGYPALIGDGGQGTLIIEDGGRFAKPGGCRIGMQSTGIGSVTLNGADSSFKVGEHLGIGEYGVGTFNVNDGRVAVGEVEPSEVPSGEVHIAGWAWLTGTGTLTGDVVNLTGWVIPGGDPGVTQTGVLTIDGDYTQQDATLTIKVKGPVQGEQYSALHVTGQVTISNVLEIKLVEGYFPPIGEQYTILTADSIDGTFPIVPGPGWYDVSYGQQNVTVTVLMSPGDLDGDNDVDLSDLAQLLGHYGMTNAVYMDGDIDRDGDVDLSDLAALLANYGRQA